MRLKEMYEAAFRAGMAADPRGEEGIDRVLARARKEFDDLPERKRWEFDQERFVNPYADTRILYGDPDTEVSSILVGIDLEVGEVLLADRLREKGRAVDLMFAHHPEGRALARLEEVMGVQADVWCRFGVSIAYGDAVMTDRMAEIMRALHPRNNEQTVQAARILGIPYMCCHTPADNSVNAFLQARCDELGTDRTVDDLLDMLKAIPEYRQAVLEGMGPTIFEGGGSRRTGQDHGRHDRGHVGPRGFPRQTGSGRSGHDRRHAYGGGPSEAGQGREDERGHRRPRVVRLAGDEPHHRPVRAPGCRR